MGKSSTPSTTEAREGWRARLQPGDVVRVTSKRGNPIEATIVRAGRDEAGLYVRLPEGRLARLLPERIDWKTCSKIGKKNPIARGDEVMIVALGGVERRGKLEDPHLDDRITVALPKGNTYSVPVQETVTKKFRLMFPTSDLRSGDEFLVRSRSGTEYRGRVLRIEPAAIIARLRRPSKRSEAVLRTDHLDLATLHVLIPVLSSTASEFDTQDSQSGDVDSSSHA